jgi:hypothetical protein
MTSGDAGEPTGEEPAFGSTEGSVSGAADGPATDPPAAEDGDSTPHRPSTPHKPSTPSTPTGAPAPAADQDRPPTARRKPGVAYRPV